MEIPIYYDNMIAKLITYADNRTEAIQRMIRAIDEFQITGIQTTLSFCKYVLGHEAFISGKFDTKFVEKYFKPEYIATLPNAEEEKVAAALVSKLMEKNGKSSVPKHHSNNAKATPSHWKNRRYNSM
jgi:acetyl/propionyl-CoA carboxylase alpha subunit